MIEPMPPEDTEQKPADYYAGVRKEIRPLIPAGTKRVLDVGCGEGATVDWLKAKRLCEWAGGIEYHDAAPAAARARLDEVFEGDIETMELSLDEASIDVILCLDVLEHLVDPWQVIAKLQRHLRPGGTLIASIPNVRCLNVLLPLIFLGRWEYQDQGILDRTHLRFFTRRSATALVAHSGLEITAVRPLRRRYARILNFCTGSLFSGFLTYQYLIAARHRAAS